MIWLVKPIFLIVIINFSYAEDVVVNIKDGRVKGRTASTVTGLTYYSFQGIPFAETPINELRFKAPVPKKPWDDVVDATYERGCCYQMTSDRPEETEDCLYVNVFTPNNPSSNSSIPVMFYIYGGGFIQGYSEFANYGPQHLMEHGVILVTFNYRVGPFGFYTTGDDFISGNAGLKDQTLALKWTNENIAYFGGDPNKITIIGQSAGAASVAYHILSPKSKGLFRAAICESGSSLSTWAYQHDEKNISYALATLLNPEFADRRANSSEVYEYLKSLPAKNIDQASYTINQWESPQYNQLQQGCFFTPTIEHEHEDAFLTKSMYDLLDKGEINKVPLMTGVNTEECLFYFNDNTTWAAYSKQFDESSTLLLPHEMNIVDDDTKNTVSALIKQFYSPNETFSDNPRNLIRYFSDQAFARSIIKHAQMQSKYGDVYFYQFAFHGVLGGQTQETVLGYNGDVRHGEEMSFVLTRNYVGYNTSDLSKYPEIDQTVQKRVITMFTNFAKFLNPTPEKDDLFQNLQWPKVEANNFQYLDIGSDLAIRKNPKNKMFNFWEDLFKKYAQPPFISY